MMYSDCRPIINNKFEEKSCGEGPSLATMFDDDKHLQGLVHSIRVSHTPTDMSFKNLFILNFKIHYIYSVSKDCASFIIGHIIIYDDICVLQEALQAAFNAASQYADTFEQYREFYKENEDLELEKVRAQEHGQYQYF